MVMAMRALRLAPTTFAILQLMSIRSRGVGAFVTTMKRARSGSGQGTAGEGGVAMMMAASNSTTATAVDPSIKVADAPSMPPPPLYVAQGLLAVHKPLTWSSNDVVSYIRGILTRDAKDRGADENQNNDGNSKKKKQWGRRKKPMMKVGHGGTLDPLASGVLVLGVGKGTTLLQSYLEGDKHYVAACELGYETDTLDAEGKLVKTAPWDHVKDMASVKEIEPKFTGKIEQVPPLYSAIRIDGKRLYEIARKDDSGKAAEKVEIPKREVMIHGLKVGTGFEGGVVRSGVVDGVRYREEAGELEEKAAAEAAAAAAVENSADAKDNTNKDGSNSDEDNGGKSNKRRRRNNKKKNKKESKKNLFNEETVPSISSESDVSLELPQFSLSVQCGGGTYIRSLVRDIGYELDTVATMTGLVRTKQGPFVLEDILMKEDWTADKIYEAIQRSTEKYDVLVK